LKIDPLPNVLGRIPSHSVRAPRPLVQVKEADGSSLKPAEEIPPEQQDQEKAISYAIVQTIEEMYNLVLETEVSSVKTTKTHSKGFKYLDRFESLRC
jgi:hypothetical protein